MDDASTDNTANLINHLTHQDNRIIGLKMQKNSGPSAARNLGWLHTSSEWIGFLDSDDTWHPQKLELQIKLTLCDPDVDLIGHLVDVRNCEGPYVEYHIKTKSLLNYSCIIDRRSILLQNPFSTPTVLLRKDLNHRFNEKQRYAEDYRLWTEILLSGSKVRRMKLPLASLYKARYGEGGLSNDLWGMEKGEVSTILSLRSQGLIKFWELCVLIAYSLTKFIYRLIKQI